MMMKAPMMQMMVVIGHWMMSYAQDMCMSSPCLNGGLCQSYDGVYTCLCPSDYTGANCETQMEYHPLDPVISVDPGFAIDPDTSLVPPPVGMGQDEHGCYADGVTNSKNAFVRGKIHVILLFPLSPKTPTQFRMIALNGMMVVTDALCRMASFNCVL